MRNFFWVTGFAAAILASGLSGCDNSAIEYLPRLPQVNIPQNKSQTPELSPQSANTAKIEEGIRQSINQVRQKEGLKLLESDRKLAGVARNYSRYMAEQNFFSHTGIDGSTPSQRVEAAGIIYWVVGENLFRGTNVPQPVEIAVKGWLESPGHRENILRPFYTETGVGVWRVKNTYYITQLFLRR
ncbi:MAG: CAP domain-containing protein [Oscillatoriaceae cyanobacterium Prado104]|nr:CAP domain-containing protein [Oscillatoriaceae cyanobacterium Prado104]